MVRKGTTRKEPEAAPVVAARERPSFLAELRRRNVIRFAGLYLVAGWLIVQVAETVLPVFGTPAWVLQTLIVLLALGFIPALVFSWVFELTPGGLKRDRDVPPEMSIGAETGRKMDRMIIVGMVVLVAVIAADRLYPEPPRLAEKPGSEPISEAGAGSAVEDPGPEIGSDPVAPPNSIAVLPFVNMSDEAGNEYFSDGISEEILNVLAGSPDLQVAARTSSFSFKGKDTEVPEIARALNVRLVLEGSVRRQGEKVRITAQLIDAETGFHRWSQTYDRELTDIFAVQDEIARAIGDALKVGLGEAVASADSHGTRGTTDVEAYDLYLRGMGLWHRRTSAGLEEAETLFAQATARDPAFAQAWAAQALVYAILPAYSGSMGWEEATTKTYDRGVHALALDPSLPEAYAALGTASLARLERETASALLRRAVALRPSYPTGHHWLGISLINAGHREEALAAFDRAVALDPRSPVIGENRAFVLTTLGRTDEARAECERILAFSPDYAACLQYAGLAAMAQKDYDAARAWFGRQFGRIDPANAATGEALVDAMAGRGDRRAMAQRMAALPFNAITDPASGFLLEDHVIVLLIAELGEPALALDFFERNGRQFGSTMDWATMLPGLDPIRCDPRFRAIVERLRTTDPRFEEVCGEGARP